MPTFEEMEDAIAAMSPLELERLQLRVGAMIKWRKLVKRGEPMKWPIPPPNVPSEEIRRIQAEIDRAFSQVPHDCAP